MRGASLVTGLTEPTILSFIFFHYKRISKRKIWLILKKCLQLTFDVTMTAEDTTDRSSVDYSAATPPLPAFGKGERSHKRTKSTTRSSRKGDPPMAKTQKSNTPLPGTPLPV
ncbi:hypothetical protein Y032_0567g41 [Ancylostoma ceylanicum]|uniref:Uncharacterized protein n=1 Tax=Ancylostoma ceylanicum TaxID=53326 RepID=A0A016WPD2_9BILA|nr:hypothetical protein Y032_0567g41 [Ancylostoma ceylanicum]